MVASMGVSCNPLSLEDFVGPLKNTTLNNADRTWWYQKCTEFAYFQPSFDNSSIFFNDITLDFIKNMCQIAFGVNLSPHVDFSNAYYGGLDIHGSEIFVTNGLKDPWYSIHFHPRTHEERHRLGLSSSKPGIQVSLYEAGHCAPMTKPTNVDPESLTQTRTEVKSFLTRLLKKSD